MVDPLIRGRFVMMIARLGPLYRPVRRNALAPRPVCTKTDTVPGQYTFGDTDLAGRRLALVAEVFEPPSRALLESSRLAGLDIIVDLGCGPGFTARLVAEVCRPRRVIGLDRSDRFVETARRLT